MIPCDTQLNINEAILSDTFWLNIFCIAVRHSRHWGLKRICYNDEKSLDMMMWLISSVNDVYRGFTRIQINWNRVTVLTLHETCHTRVLDDNMTSRTLHETCHTRVLDDNMTSRTLHETCHTRVVDDNMTSRTLHETCHTRVVDDNMTSRTLHGTCHTRVVDDNMTSRTLHGTCHTRVVDDNMTSRTLHETCHTRVVDDIMTSRTFHEICHTRVVHEKFGYWCLCAFNDNINKKILGWNLDQSEKLESRWSCWESISRLLLLAWGFFHENKNFAAPISNINVMILSWT